MDKAIYEIISMIITAFFALAAAILGSLPKSYCILQFLIYFVLKEKNQLNV